MLTRLVLNLKWLKILLTINTSITDLEKIAPEITTYNIVNFYKLDLLYTFSQMYDEVLYLDFDVVPMTNENFFKVWDLEKGITVLNNDDNVLFRLVELQKLHKLFVVRQQSFIMQVQCYLKKVCLQKIM